MKVKDIVKEMIHSNREHLTNLKIRKKLTEYVKSNDVNQLYSIVHETYEPVFVLSTGRCGTALMTNLFEANDSLKAYHEPSPEFFYHTLMAFNQHKSSPDKISAVFDVARYELIRNTFIEGKRYIETNNRVTFFANQIATLYPKAKFIHLVRNPHSFIKSGISRNWYSGHSLYDEGKIKSDSNWNQYSQIEKIGWLWNETNSFIEEFKLNNPAKILTIKAESLFTEIKTQKSIFEFISVKAPSDSVLKRISSHKVNEGGKMEFSEEQRQKIQLCVSQLSLCKKYDY